MVTRSIEGAQRKVEGHNFEIRKHLLEYDNVMNEQRRVIYRIRKDILSDSGNHEFIMEMIEDICENIFNSYLPEKKMPLEAYPWEDISKSFQTMFKTEKHLQYQECLTKFNDDAIEYLTITAKEILEKKFSQYEQEQVKLAMREILLSIFDQYWKDHLLAMDHVKEGVNLKAYAQKNPLTEYKREGFNLFEKMRMDVKKAVLEAIFSVTLYTKEEVEQLQRRHQEELEKQLEQHRQMQELNESNQSKPIARGQNKVGRNDACPCGSGKKFKQCHGA